MTGGNVYWVAPSATYTIEGRSYSASDNNDGLSPERALLTLAQAVSNATANAGDCIMLLPGAHSWSSSVALSKAGLTIEGLPYMPKHAPQKGMPMLKPQASITTSAADEIINVTAADTTFVNLTVIPVTAQRGIDFTAAASRLTFRDCYVDMKTPAGHASTKGLSATTATVAPSYLYIANCFFEEENVGTSQGAAIDVGAAVMYCIENCTFWKDGSGAAVQWTSAILVNDNSLGTIRDCDFITTANIAIASPITGVNTTSSSACGILRCFFSDDCAVPIENFGAGDAYIANNYKANVSGGGSIVAEIT